MVAHGCLKERQRALGEFVGFEESDFVFCEFGTRFALELSAEVISEVVTV